MSLIKFPMTKHRTVNVPVPGDPGTFDTFLGTGALFYGIVRIHQKQTIVIVDKNESITAENILLIERAQYRVVREIFLPMASRREFEVERIKKPMIPLGAELS